MTKMKPILFSTAMVQALLAGTKTQTRRVIKPQPVSDFDSGYVFWGKHQFDIHGMPYFEELPKLAKYQPGDFLWVRETWTENGLGYYRYKADWDDPSKGLFIGPSIPDKFRNKWKPSIFMSRKASRLFLEVTEVRAERLQDISEEDAKAEGVLYYGDDCDDYKNYEYNDVYGDDWGVKTAKASYETLWESINGHGSWDLNPWVFVYTFKIVTP